MMGRLSLRRLSAFTLVELLIALAIVALLVALLLPALLAALGVGRMLHCQNQLRQISIAYGLYLGDSGGLWPPLLSHEAPEELLERIERETGLKRAPARPAPDWGQPGPHWSVVLWPYLGDLDVYTCPSDPKAGLRGREVLPPGREHSVAFLDAPPESYGLNVILFRTADAIRRQAGCTWGTRGDVDFSGLSHYTTLAEQRRVFGDLSDRILFFCGTSGYTVGSQNNIAFRTCGPAQRWEWHPKRASAPFADEPGCGGNYLYVGGHVEYHDRLPDLWAWGYRLE